MSPLDFVLQLLVWMALTGLVFYVAYTWGYRKGYDQRIEDLGKNVAQAYNKAKADAEVLAAVARPRSRAARIRSTSRRADQAGPEE